MDKLGKEGKCKVHPRTGHEGTEGEYTYSYNLSLTSALEEGGSTTPRPGRFTRGRDPEPIVQKDRWAPRNILDWCEKSCPHQDSIPRPSSS